MSRKGITLMEMMFVIIIMGLTVGILLESERQIHASFQLADISVALQSQARIAINRIATDLQQTNAASVAIVHDAPVVGTDTIQYSLPVFAGNPFVPGWNNLGIQWDPAAFTISVDQATGRLLKQQGANTIVLANNVNKVNFINHAANLTLDSTELRVILTMQGVASNGRAFSLTRTATLRMRNS